MEKQCTSRVVARATSIPRIIDSEGGRKRETIILFSSIPFVQAIWSGWVSLFSHCAGTFVKASRQFVEFFFFLFFSDFPVDRIDSPLRTKAKIAGLEMVNSVVRIVRHVSLKDSSSELNSKIVLKIAIMLFLKFPFRRIINTDTKYDEMNEWMNVVFIETLSSVFGCCGERCRLWNLSLKAVPGNLILSRWNLVKKNAGWMDGWMDGGWKVGLRATGAWEFRFPRSRTWFNFSETGRTMPFYLFNGRRRN